MSSTLPKLSYVLLSHNREKYIRAAIESAFAQDYDGELEYIFSDDCSTDSTFEIIKECVAAYKGNRRVVVTQTPHNLHLAGNTNHAVQFVESDWIVRADDDDYSSVDRCTIAAQAILSHPNSSYIALRMTYFNDSEASSAFNQALKKREQHPTFSYVDVSRGDKACFSGGAYSYKIWHADVYKKFSQLDLNAYYVDDLIAFYRANVLGVGVYVESDSTIYALKGDDNMCRGGKLAKSHYEKCLQQEYFNDKYFNITLKPLEDTFNEIKRYIEMSSRSDYDSYAASLEESIEERRIVSSFWRAGTYNRIKITRKLGRTGLFNFIRCLPLPIFAFCYSVAKNIKAIYKR